jgi:hypothetical protein
MYLEGGASVFLGGCNLSPSISLTPPTEAQHASGQSTDYSEDNETVIQNPPLSDACIGHKITHHKAKGERHH